MGTCLIAWMMLIGATVLPSEVPDPRWHGGWVSDNAEVLTAQQEARIDAVGDDLHRSHGIELVLVTVLDVPDTPQVQLAELFARWELGAHRGRGAVMGLWVADRQRWVWREGPGVSLGLTVPDPNTPLGLVSWFQQVADALRAPPKTVSVVADKAAWWSIFHPAVWALGLVAVLVLVGRRMFKSG